MSEEHEKVPAPNPENDGPDADLPDLITFMQASPLAAAIREDGIDFEVERSQDLPRDIDFD
ncbi:MAG TPA: hypothetical protein VEX86_11520 [Longimicrobium sp.]|nr:hypothetical protein [Longimicrobium sp.]